MHRLQMFHFTAQHSLLFFLKTKPGQELTQSIEVQFLVFLNNYGYPNSFSTIFPLQLFTICQHEKEQMG